jgi:hypothetical protein
MRNTILISLITQFLPSWKTPKTSHLSPCHNLPRSPRLMHAFPSMLSIPHSKASSNNDPLKLPAPAPPISRKEHINNAMALDFFGPSVVVWKTEEVKKVRKEEKIPLGPPNVDRLDVAGGLNPGLSEPGN